MPKPRIRYRYRDRPKSSSWPAGLTVDQIKQWVVYMVPIVTATWLFLGPYINAQAGEYLKGQLILIGMDPTSIQTLNKNLIALQQNVDELAKNKNEATDKLSSDVQDLKSQLGTVLELMKLQTLKGEPPVAEPVK